MGTVIQASPKTGTLKSKAQIQKVIDAHVQAISLIAPYSRLKHFHIEPRVASLQLLEDLAAAEGGTAFQVNHFMWSYPVVRSVSGVNYTLYFTCEVPVAPKSFYKSSN